MKQAPALRLTEMALMERSRTGRRFAVYRMLIIQHLLEDTEEFIRLLNRYEGTPAHVLGIAYSSRSDVYARLKSSGISVEVPLFAELPKVVAGWLTMACEGGVSPESSGILIHEVGGYCANWIAQNTDLAAKRIVGVVEETRQGLWRYMDARPSVPVLQIANSKLKTAEHRYVGESVALGVQSDLEALGRNIRDARILVLGFGGVGSGVARQLVLLGAKVTCFDCDAARMLEAHVLDFRIGNREREMSIADVIVGASGTQSINRSDLRLLKDGVLLVSASSRDIEFPVEELSGICDECAKITHYVVEYRMPWSKRINLSTEGFPINFRERSLPPPIADLIFSQVVHAMGKLVDEELPPGIHSLMDRDVSRIAKQWLEIYGATGQEP